MRRSELVGREGKWDMRECLVRCCLKSILEDALISTQLSIPRILLKAFLCGFKSNWRVFLQMRADVRQEFRNTKYQSGIPSWLETVDIRVDKQTNLCWKRYFICSWSKEEGYFVLFLIVPMLGNSIQRFSSFGKERKGLQIFLFCHSPRIAHSLHQSCHPREGFIPLLIPPSHFKTQIIVFIGIDKIIKTIEGLHEIEFLIFTCAR